MPPGIVSEVAVKVVSSRLLPIFVVIMLVKALWQTTGPRLETDREM